MSCGHLGPLMLWAQPGSQVDALGSTWLYDWGTYSTEISWQGPGKHGGAWDRSWSKTLTVWTLGFEGTLVLGLHYMPFGAIGGPGAQGEGS